MPFFLPSRLVDFEYFDTSNEDKEYDRLAKDYQKEIDFAFFVVNFGYSKADYEALTRKEKVFIYKAWENKTVQESTHLRNSVLNAVNNALRKKGKKFVHLWKKKQKKLDKDVAKENMKIIRTVESNEGKAWVDLIYKANGLTAPRRKGA